MSVEHSEFQSLLDELDELDTLRKARAADESPKTRPAFDPNDLDPDSEEYEQDEPEDEKEEDEPPRKRKPFGKSFAVTLDDGAQVEAMDGTAVIAALQADVAAIGVDLQKALRTLVSLTKTQATEIDSLRKSHTSELQALRDAVTALGQRPRGRKSVLDVHEPALTPDLDVDGSRTALDGQAILAKASTMNLDPVTMAVLCELVNTKQPLPPHLAKAFQ